MDAFFLKLVEAMKGSIPMSAALTLAFGLVKWAAWKDWTEVGLAVSASILLVSVCAVGIKPWRARLRREAWARRVAERRAQEQAAKRQSMIRGLKSLGNNERDELLHLLRSGNRTGIYDISDAEIATLMHRQILTRTSDVSHGGALFAVALTTLALDCLDEAGIQI